MCLLGDVPATRPFKSAIRTVVRVCATKYKRISIGLTFDTSECCKTHFRIGYVLISQ